MAWKSENSMEYGAIENQKPRWGAGTTCEWVVHRVTKCQGFSNEKVKLAKRRGSREIKNGWNKAALHRTNFCLQDELKIRLMPLLSLQQS